MKKIIIIAIAAIMALPFASFDASAQKKKLEEVTFSCNLHCNSCVNKVKENISYERGVKDLKVSLDEQSIYVKFDPSKTSVEKLQKAIGKLGYEASPATPGHCKEGHCKEGQCKEGHCKEGQCKEGQCKEGQCGEGEHGHAHKHVHKK